eukprot:g5898.t1
MRLRAAPRKSALDELKENPSVETLVRELPKMDIFPKLEEEHRSRTETGGASSLIAFVFMAIMFLSEFASYVRPPLTERIEVDRTMNERLRIHMNVSFWRITCAEVEVIAMDVLGEHQINVASTTHKHRLSANGEPIGEKFLQPKFNNTKFKPLPPDYCGSCYGAAAAGKCCNTCDQVREAYNDKGWSTTDLYATSEQCLRENKDPSKQAQKGEGCEVEGVLEVSKVSGNFHVALGKSKSVDGRLIHEFNPSEAEFFNTSHRVNFLSFGPPVPGVTNPMDGQERIVDPHKSATAVYQYFIKIVPTQYNDIRTNQYSFTQKVTPMGEGSDAKKAHAAHHGHGHRHPTFISSLPGVFFVYELSPFLHAKKSDSVSFFHFFTRCCAIIGGTFSFSRLIGTIIEKAKGTRNAGTFEDKMPRGGFGHHGHQVGGRDSIGAFLHPTNGYRGSLAKRGVQPKNHARENMRALKSKQSENRARKEAQQAAQQRKDDFKLARFRNVQGRAMQSAAAAAPGAEKENGGHAFMRKGAGRRASAAAPSPPKAREYAAKLESPVKKPLWSPGALPRGEEYVPESKRNLAGRNRRAAVPTRAELQERAGAVPAHEQRDFVAANNRKAKAMQPVSRTSPRAAQGVAAPAARHKHSSFGRVPAYLHSRKAQWAAAEEQRREAAGDPNCPPGMALMPEAERLETLAALKKSEAEGKRQLMKLPLRVETASQQRKKAELEGKMKEIEEAVAIFSREKVFINKD